MPSARTAAEEVARRDRYIDHLWAAICEVADPETVEQIREAVVRRVETDDATEADGA